MVRARLACLGMSAAMFGAAAQDTACGRDVPDPPANLAANRSGPAPTPTPMPGSGAQDDCHCSTHKNLYFSMEGDHGVGTRKLLDAPAECCAACKLDTDCTYWSFFYDDDSIKHHKGACELQSHSGTLSSHYAVNRTSGYLAPGADPAPSPTPDPEPSPPTPNNWPVMKVFSGIQQRYGWTLYAAFGGILVSLLVCVAAIRKRFPGALGGAMQMPPGRPKRRNYERVAINGSDRPPPGYGAVDRQLPVEYHGDTEQGLHALTTSERDCQIDMAGSVPAVHLSVVGLSKSHAESQREAKDEALSAVDMVALVEDFTAAVSKLSRDRKKGVLWTYRRCFVGNEAVEWIQHRARVRGEPDSQEAATMCAQELLAAGIIGKVDTSGRVKGSLEGMRQIAVDHTAIGRVLSPVASETSTFVPQHFYRLCALVDGADGASDLHDASWVVDGLEPPGDPNTVSISPRILVEEDPLLEFALAIKVLASAVHIGVEPTMDCRERIARCIPVLLSRTARACASIHDRDTRVPVDPLKHSAGVAPVKFILDADPHAEVKRQGHALECALLDAGGATHTLYTQSDRFLNLALSLRRNSADTTRQFNLTHCPLLILLSIDGIRPSLLRHLVFTDLCRFRLVCKPAIQFVHDMLVETPTPLVIGGTSGTSGQVLSSVEQLLMFRMTWNSLPNLLEPRQDPAVCNDANGHVFVAGGRNNREELRTVESYDPVARMWTRLPSMSTPRTGSRACLLDDGQIIMLGGFDGRGAVADVALFDPVRREWKTLRDMCTPRTGFAACTLPGGLVVVAGGFNESGALPTAEIYNVHTNTWSLLPSMATERSGCAGCYGPGGRLWVTGGRSMAGQRLSSCEVLMLAASTNGDGYDASWAPAPPMLSPRYQHGLCTIGTRSACQLVAAGGEGAPTSPRSSGRGEAQLSIELFDMVAQRWVPMAEMPASRTPSTMATCMLGL